MKTTKLISIKINPSTNMTSVVANNMSNIGHMIQNQTAANIPNKIPHQASQNTGILPQNNSHIQNANNIQSCPSNYGQVMTNETSCNCSNCHQTLTSNQVPPCNRNMYNNMCYAKHLNQVGNQYVQMQTQYVGHENCQQNPHKNMDQCASKHNTASSVSTFNNQVMFHPNMIYHNTNQNMCMNRCVNHQSSSTNCASNINSFCHQQNMKPPSPMYNNYVCNNTLSPPNYGTPQVSEPPLTSPAMATPAPIQTMTQPQQAAQMSRPCLHNNYIQTDYCHQRISNPKTTCNCVKNNYDNCHMPTTEIPCRDINQSQMSPGVANSSANIPALGMRQDAYQRTLEYVQNCQSWVENRELVSSTTQALNKCTESNMVINDMTSSLTSLLEENRYLQMIQ